MAGTGNGNQRVTNAILGVKLDHVIEGQEEIKAGMQLNTEARIASTERWTQHDKEHSSLRAKSWAGDIGAAITGAVAAIGVALTKAQ